MIRSLALQVGGRRPCSASWTMGLCSLNLVSPQISPPCLLIEPLPKNPIQKPPRCRIKPIPAPPNGEAPLLGWPGVTLR